MQGNPDLKKSFSKSLPCLWVQAGVVRKKQCNHNYNCAECTFDRVMMQTVNENKELCQSGQRPVGKRVKIISWRDKLSSLPMTKRPCIHHMKGRIEFRLCTNEYRCGSCEFDQFFNDQYSVNAVMNPVEVLNVAGFGIPQGYYFHHGHAWVKIEEENSVRIGIDDFAARIFGGFESITAPLMGKRVIRNRPSIQLKRGGQSAMILSPVSGIVVGINSILREKGGLANTSPYAEGWVMKVKPDNLREDIKHLMINRESLEYIKEQASGLLSLVKEISGSEGEWSNIKSMDDISGKLQQIGWDRLVSLFLKD